MHAAFCATLLAFLTLQACVNKRHTEPERVALGPPITVMSFNIRYGTADDGPNAWPHRKDITIEAIRRRDPDILALQEALRFQIDQIRAALPHYEEVGAGRDDGKTKGEYAAILYRAPRLKLRTNDRNSTGDVPNTTFWLSETPDVPASKHWGNAIPRICTWASLQDTASGQAFDVYNVHLDHQSDPSRRKSVELVARHTVKRFNKHPLILTGDFNCGPQSRSVRFITGELGRAVEGSIGLVAGWAPLTDTFHALHPDEPNAGTFHAFEGEPDVTGKPIPKGAVIDRIDYIFADPRSTILSADIDRWHQQGRYPSDHYPVVATIRLPLTSPATP